MMTRCARGWRKRQHLRLYYAHVEYHLLFKFSKKKENSKIHRNRDQNNRLYGWSDLKPCDYLSFEDMFNTYRHRYVLSITEELSRVCNYNTQMYAHRMNIWVPTRCLVNKYLPFCKFEISLFHFMYHYTLHHCSKT